MTTRRDFLKTVGTGYCLLAQPFITLANQEKKAKPNIVLCMADDQGWGDMGYYGHPVLQTPHFDAMAKESLRFDRFYAAAPICSPTRGSVLTGRNPNRFGCFSWGNTLRPQEITIAEALKTAGYVTGHFGKWHLGSVQNGSPVNPAASGFDEWVSAPNFFDNDPILSKEGDAVPMSGESSMVTVDAAIQFIRKHAESERPFLAVVWFGSPHSPHQAVEEDREPYADESEKLQHFYGEITGMDRAFGKLRKELRSLQLHEDTILWYCSDNGGLPNLGATGGRGNKGDIYEGGLRVPAMLEWPGHIETPRQSNIPCTTSDIYPTLLDIVGVDLERQPPLDGISLAPLLRNEMEERPEPIGFWSYKRRGMITPSKEWMQELLEAQQEGQQYSKISRLRLESARIDEEVPEDRFPGHAAWLKWPWKLHRIQRDEDTVKYELYNLEKDPEEENNVVEERVQIVEAMKKELENWQISVLQSLNGKDYE